MKTVILFISLLLIGCSPATRLNRIYMNHPELMPKDTTIVEIVERDSIIYQDTTIFVRLPPDTVVISGEVIPIPNGEGKVQISPLKLQTETDYSKASAWIDDMRLYLELIDKDTTLLIQLDSLRKEAYYWKDQYNTTTTVFTEIETFIPAFYKVMTWVGLGVIVLLIAGVVLRMKL